MKKNAYSTFIAGTLKTAKGLDVAEHSSADTFEDLYQDLISGKATGAQLMNLLDNLRVYNTDLVESMLGWLLADSYEVQSIGECAANSR